MRHIGSVRSQLFMARELVVQLDVAQETRSLTDDELSLRKMLKLQTLGARLRPWPGGPAAPVGCNLPCLWSWPASEPGFPEPKTPSLPGPLETTKTLVSLEPSSWRRTQAILGGGGVARAGSGGKGKLLRVRPCSSVNLLPFSAC